MRSKQDVLQVNVLIVNKRGEEKAVPELRISLQLQHRGVCVPLQCPDVTNRGRGRAREDMHVYKQTPYNKYKNTKHTCRAQTDIST